MPESPDQSEHKRAFDFTQWQQPREQIPAPAILFAQAECTFEHRIQQDA
jgi:hypothetical protein